MADIKTPWDLLNRHEKNKLRSCARSKALRSLRRTYRDKWVELLRECYLEKGVPLTELTRVKDEAP